MLKKQLFLLIVLYHTTTIFSYHVTIDYIQKNKQQEHASIKKYVRSITQEKLNDFSRELPTKKKSEIMKALRKKVQ